MIRESSLSVEGDDIDLADDAELGRVLEAFLADLEAGRVVDRARLLAGIRPSRTSYCRASR